MRLRDGAILTASAAQSGDGFVADNDGITYTVTAKSLVIDTGGRVMRQEPMVDFNRPDTPAPVSVPVSVPATTTTPSVPLPPPLPAEVGGGR